MCLRDRERGTHWADKAVVIGWVFAASLLDCARPKKCPRELGNSGGVAHLTDYDRRLA